MNESKKLTLNICGTPNTATEAFILRNCGRD